jgi:hypothetical protein
MANAAAQGGFPGMVFRWVFLTQAFCSDADALVQRRLHPE